MADILNNFQSLANDAPNVMITSRMFQLSERNMVTGQFAKEYTLESRMGKTMRIVRYNRFNLPVAQLTDGVPPDAVGLGFVFVDVTLEQWGIIALLTDVAQVTITHPILQIAIERCALAIAELTERENCKVLMTGTQVIYGNAGVASRDLIVSTGSPKTDRCTTATVIAATTQLRALGAPPWENNLYGGIIQPQQESDLFTNDTTLQNASNFARVRRLENAEIGIWMGVHWARGNFLPIFVGATQVSTAAATSTKPQATVADVGGSLATGNYKVTAVAREITSDYERKINVTSANLAVSASVTTGAVTVVAPSSLNYVYDLYMTQVGGTTLYKVASRVAASSTTIIQTAPVGTETIAPVAPLAGTEVFVGWILAKDAFARVKLDEMSMQSYITPAGASWSNALAQGRKVGTKMMYKAAIQDQTYLVRMETVSTYSSYLAA